MEKFRSWLEIIHVVLSIFQYLLYFRRFTIGEGLCLFFLLSHNIYSGVNTHKSLLNIQEGQISPINCIRFFSMVWVLLSHLLINYVNIVGEFLVSTNSKKELLRSKPDRRLCVGS